MEGIPRFVVTPVPLIELELEKNSKIFRDTPTSSKHFGMKKHRLFV